MTADLDDVVRRAFDNIIGAAGDLGSCPAPNASQLARDDASRDLLRSGTRNGAAGHSASTARRWVAVAAGLLLVVGVGGIAWIEQRPDARPPASGTIDLGPVDRFGAGTVATIDDPPLFVVNDPSTGITVFDAHSTHLRCILVVNGSGTDDSDRSPNPDAGFVDPCHGSFFDRSGNKLGGPAPRGMDTYPVTITDEHLLVDLSQPITGDPATIPTYPGEGLDTALPLVGRAWADSMDFSLAPDDNARLYTAWQTAIAECMHGRGYNDYQPVPYPPNTDFQDRVNPLDRRYATIMGYHELPAEPVDPNTHTDESYVSAGDCANSAYADTFGRLRDYINVNDQLRGSLSAAIDDFPASDLGRAVTSRWAECMAERAHQYQSRVDAITAYAARPTIRAVEIATRLDDLDCDVEVGYTAAQHDWEQAQINTWRQDHRDAIQNALDQKQLVAQQLAEIEASQRNW